MSAVTLAFPETSGPDFGEASSILNRTMLDDQLQNRPESSGALLYGIIRAASDPKYKPDQEVIDFFSRAYLTGVSILKPDGGFLTQGLRDDVLKQYGRSFNLDDPNELRNNDIKYGEVWRKRRERIAKARGLAPR